MSLLVSFGSFLNLLALQTRCSSLPTQPSTVLSVYIFTIVAIGRPGGKRNLELRNNDLTFRCYSYRNGRISVSYLNVFAVMGLFKIFRWALIFITSVRLCSLALLYVKRLRRLEIGHSCGKI